jgi:hypothetical protein
LADFLGVGHGADPVASFDMDKFAVWLAVEDETRFRREIGRD